MLVSLRHFYAWFISEAIERISLGLGIRGVCTEVYCGNLIFVPLLSIVRSILLEAQIEICQLSPRRDYGTK
jgi:hypothetical protein